jgi:tetratricopeptide (TPR) repeat protein
MMLSMGVDEHLGTGRAALAAGRWADARVAFEAALSDDEGADACSGLAAALWWLGENQASVAYYRRAYSLHRQDGDAASAVQCAVSLAITYKANFGNFVAANGWLGRAERLWSRSSRDHCVEVRRRHRSVAGDPDRQCVARLQDALREVLLRDALPWLGAPRAAGLLVRRGPDGLHRFWDVSSAYAAVAGR